MHKELAELGSYNIDHQNTEYKYQSRELTYKEEMQELRDMPLGLDKAE